MMKPMAMEALYMPIGGLEKEISSTDINRPALQLVGFFDYFDDTRIQVLGMVEHTYLDKFDEEERRRILDRLFSFKFPALVITRSMECYPEMLEIAEKYKVPVYSAVANMSIALERRDFLKSIDCFVCNLQEAGILFSDDYSEKSAEEMMDIISEKVQAAAIPSMIVTMGGKGAVYADKNGDKGFCPARRVNVVDTTGAGDAFCAGVAIGLTYGKDLKGACDIGAHLAASVIVTTESVCPRFMPRELGLNIDVKD
jgi:sugar/nucleoside kinase (ribokinase family)